MRGKQFPAINAQDMELLYMGNVCPLWRFLINVKTQNRQPLYSDAWSLVLITSLVFFKLNSESKLLSYNS